MFARTYDSTVFNLQLFFCCLFPELTVKNISSMYHHVRISNWGIYLRKCLKNAKSLIWSFIACPTNMVTRDFAAFLYLWYHQVIISLFFKSSTSKYEIVNASWLTCISYCIWFTWSCKVGTFTRNCTLCSIISGRCPYYNSYQGNIDEKNCRSLSGSCPSEHFQSRFSVKCKY